MNNARDVRIDMGMTQKEFGALFGVDQTRVSSWECGRSKPTLYRQHLIEAAATAIENGGVRMIAESLAACGPAFAWWRILDKAYSA